MAAQQEHQHQQQQEPQQQQRETRDTPRTTRVAIVGGGCAGVAAAWQLSQLPGFEVSVYERSWRLGGKGASVRDAQGRIKEHGLHLWLGFYENAFKMIRECYDEVAARNWGPHREEPNHRLAHARFEDAFFAEPHIGVTGKDCAGQQMVWSGLFPPEKGLPGDPFEPGTNPFTLASYLLRCVDLLKTLMLSVIAQASEDVPGKSRPEARSALDELIDRASEFDATTAPEVLIERLAARSRDGTLTIAAAMLQAVSIFERLLQDFSHSPTTVASLINLLRALAAQARKQLRDFVAIDEKLRWKTEIIDIVMTIAVGLYRDRVLLDKHGLDAINDLDYRAWLKKHGASETSLNSRFITGIYDLVFAYEHGDCKRPKLAAGVALRGALRMFFTYRGSMFWRMRSGMGDAIFAPLYKVMQLADRKPKTGGDSFLTAVKFYFRYELDAATFEVTREGKRFVKQLTFAVAGPEGSTDNPGDAALDRFGCWPDDDVHHLSQREELHEKRTVVRANQDDFDAVIFAMGRDDFADLLARSRLIVNDEPVDADGRIKRDWDRQWESVRVRGQTVATKAAQVWLKKDLEGLGWYRGPAIISALGLSFDTWADMTHTLPSERAWQHAIGRRPVPDDDARSVAYFCGVLADKHVTNPLVSAEEFVALNLRVLLVTELSALWPAAFTNEKDRPPTTARDLVIGEPFSRANTVGSDRYSLSLPGTIAGRLSPLDRFVVNMTVAGDWTACGLDAGCVEAAVMSGMLAAHAITGTQPALESIIGYDHP
jgi:uncharacterized protein with NAD-binding domain and iron-sulfur cluster